MTILLLCISMIMLLKSQSFFLNLTKISFFFPFPNGVIEHSYGHILYEFSSKLIDILFAYLHLFPLPLFLTNLLFN